MHSIVIAYIVVQIIFAVIAALAIVMVVEGQKKPSCKGKCTQDVSSDRNYVEGTSCEDLKSLGNYSSNQTFVDRCKSQCGSSVNWVSACHYTNGTVKDKCLDCTSLKEVKEIFESSGAATLTQKAIEKFTNDAFSVLNSLDVPIDKKQVLADFGKSLMFRTV